MCEQKIIHKKKTEKHLQKSFFLDHVANNIFDLRNQGSKSLAKLFAYTRASDKYTYQKSQIGSL